MKTIEEFEAYFQSDLAAIDEELEKSKAYSKMIDEELQKINDAISASGGYMKGGQHYLIEHIKNAVALQSQRQSLRKDKFAIRKAIIDYANKNTDHTKADEFDMRAAIDRLTKTELQPTSNTIITNSDDDSYIDEVLNSKK